MSAVLPAVAAGINTDSADSHRAAVVIPELSAAERLEASRSRLRSALMQISHPPVKPSLLDDLKLGKFGDQLIDRIKGLPGATLVLSSLEHWWAEHPLHTAGVLAEEASRRFVAPMARRNPVAVVVGGVVVGALFAFSKPWRWLLRPALFVGLVPQLATQALKRMPLDSWLQMLSTFTAKKPAVKAGVGQTTTNAPVREQAPHLPKDL